MNPALLGALLGISVCIAAIVLAAVVMPPLLWLLGRWIAYWK